MASSSSGVVKRERGDDKVEGTAKQAKCVKEESSMKPMVPKIGGSVAASLSPEGVSLRQLNLDAGRLPGHCADGRVLEWPTWGGWKEYYISESGTVELCVKPTQVVKAEPRVTRPSFTPVYTPVGGDGGYGGMNFHLLSGRLHLLSKCHILIVFLYVFYTYPIHILITIRQDKNMLRI
jgi:hypothetical protein